MNNVENEIAKYKKKKPSSKSKSKEKSKHKHEYKDCLLVEQNGHPCKAKYCIICGKISDIQMFETNEERMVLHDDEVFYKYKDLEKFYIDDIFQKYVSINKNEVKNELLY